MNSTDRKRTLVALSSPPALELAGNLLHCGVARFVSKPRRKRPLVCHEGTRGFVHGWRLSAIGELPAWCPIQICKREFS
jgi:hypothetical protein